MSDWQYDPAHDLTLSGTDRQRSLGRESTLLESALQWTWHTTVGFYMQLWHRWKIVGGEHLPHDPPYVLIANHSSHLDALVLACLVPWRQHARLFPLAAGDYWFESGWRAGFAASVLNALPMWRGRARRQEVMQMRNHLSENRCIYIIFPEGTRTKTGELGEFKAGLGMLVAGTAVPVIPCWLDGCYDACPRNSKWIRPVPITIHIGPPLRFDDLTSSRDGWEAVATQAQAAVAALEPIRSS